MGTPIISTRVIFCADDKCCEHTDRDAVNDMHQQLMKLRSCKGHKECDLETGESCHVMNVLALMLHFNIIPVNIQSITQ